MAWKKDLEKLKKSLGPEDAAPPRPAPKPRPTEVRAIEDEDAMFLQAMGHRSRPAVPEPRVPEPPLPEPQGSRPLPAAPPRPSENPPAPAPPLPFLPEAPGAEFTSAMGDLKGLVPLRPAPVTRARPVQKPEALPPPLPVAEPAIELPPPPAPEPAPEAAATPAPAASTEPGSARAVQINLAAGMAVEVDGALDLKGHGWQDAEERLKERILDGHALGWRTLHVTLGPSEELRRMLLDLLAGPAGASIARFAQAPIPMGGSNAWILYFRISAPSPEAG